MERSRTAPRTWVVVFGVAALSAGVGTVAWAQGATRPPNVADVERYCDAEEQGAHQLAEDLRRRTRDLDSRERSIALKEGELVKAEGRLKVRLESLEAVRAELIAMLSTAEDARDVRIAGIVKMVEANRPSEVAPMFSLLEEDLSVVVLDRMNRKKAGKLLTALDPAKAATLAERMAEPVKMDIP